jgi:hypothetical protein
MTARTRALAAVCAAALGVAGLAACTSDDPAPGPAPTATTATTGTAAASAPSATSAAPGGTALDEEEAQQRGVAALLPEGAMTKVGFAYATKPEAGKWSWYEPCTGRLPSDKQLIGGAHARWSDGKRTLDQVVAFYPPAAAEAAVEQAERLTTCTTWAFDDGTQATGLAKRELDTIAGVSAQFSWCETIKAVTRCTAVVSVGDAVARVWVLSDPAADTQETVDTFATLTAARLASQPR